MPDYYAGAKFTGIGLISVGVLNVAASLYAAGVGHMHELMYWDAGLGLLSVATGVVGLLAGTKKQKGLLIGYMVMAIIHICAHVLGAFVWSVLGEACDGHAARCTQSGEPYCCEACADATTCGSNGCMYLANGYDTWECQGIPANVRWHPGTADDITTAWDESRPCDRACCEALSAVYPQVAWVANNVKPQCIDGHNSFRLSEISGTVSQCEYYADAQTDGCIIAKETTYDYATGDPPYWTNLDLDLSLSLRYTNAGCHVDSGGYTSATCDVSGLVTVLFVVAIIVAIVGSVMACCVACCGKGNDKEDSG